MTKKIKEDWVDKEAEKVERRWDSMNKRAKMKWLDFMQSKTDRSHDYTWPEVEDALDDHGIDVSKEARKKWEQNEMEQEAYNMHNYVNTLSMGRSVNLWAEAAKRGEDPEAVKGKQTFTKKPQQKIELNPREK